MTMNTKQQIVTMTRQVADLGHELRRTKARADETRGILLAMDNRDRQRFALDEADRALRDGRWPADHAGGNQIERDPARRVELTRQWLAQRIASGDLSFLAEPGTHDNAAALRHLAPADPDRALSDEIGRIQEAAAAEGTPVSFTVAMQRIQKSQPWLITSYENRKVG